MQTPKFRIFAPQMPLPVKCRHGAAALPRPLPAATAFIVLDPDTHPPTHIHHHDNVVTIPAPPYYAVSADKYVE